MATQIRGAQIKEAFAGDGLYWNVDRNVLDVQVDGVGIQILGDVVTAVASGIDHDALMNFLANEHIDWTVSGSELIDESRIVDSDIDHGSLSGLTDDDHEQYILVDGSRAFTGNIKANASGTLDFGSASIPFANVYADYFYGDGWNITNVDANKVIMETISGATYSTAQHMQDIFHSAGWSSGGTITSGTTTSVAVAAGTGFIRSTDSDVATIYFFDWDAEASLSVPLDTIRYIGVDYNAGSPQAVVRSTYDWNFNTDFPLGTVVNEDGYLHVINASHAVGDHASNMIQRSYETMPFERDNRSGGLILGETGTRNVTVTAGSLWERLERFSIGAVDTSASDTFDRYYRDGGGDWTKEASETQWDNTQYDDGSGSLVTISGGYYSVQYFYIELDGELVSLYGQAQYADLASAQDDSAPSDLPDRLTAHGKLIGRIIFVESASTASVIESVFDTSFSATVVTDHGSLAGLSDDDHIQYALLTGVRPFTGDVTINSQNEIRLADSDNSHYVGFRAASTTTSTAIWTLPAAGFVLDSTFISDASGNLTMGGHDDLAGFVADEHVPHSTISVSGTGILSGGGTIDNDVTITLASSDVDHDLTTNFVADEHVAHSSITVTGTGLLTGGGTIDGNVTINLVDSSITHNSIGGLQGGGATERYHLTSLQHGLLTSVSGVEDATSEHMHDSRYYTETEIDTLVTTTSGDIISYVDAQDTAISGSLQSDIIWEIVNTPTVQIRPKPAHLSKAIYTEGNVTIGGDLTVTGTLFYADVETVQVTDNIMHINYGEVGAGVTAGEAGIQIDRGSETDYYFVFDEGTDTFRIGVSGTQDTFNLTELQPVATREDVPIDMRVPWWDASSYTFRNQGDTHVTINSGTDTITFTADSTAEMYVGTGGLKLKNSTADVNEILNVNEADSISASSTDDQLATAKLIYNYINTVSGAVLHNNRPDLQGGTSGEYYHLTSDQHSNTVVMSMSTDSGALSPVSNLVTISGGEGMDVTHSANNIVVAGEDASDTNKGIASFLAADFDVASGAVSLEDTVVKTVTTDTGALTPASHSFSILGGTYIDVTHSGTVITAEVDSTYSSNWDAAYTHSQVTTGNPHSLDLDDVTDGSTYCRVLCTQLNSGVYIDATTSTKGIASFDSGDFAVTSGAVSIKAGGIGNAQLENSTITVSGGDGLTTTGSPVSLGGTVELDINVDNSTIEIVSDTLRVKDGGITEAKLDIFNTPTASGQVLSWNDTASQFQWIDIDTEIDAVTESDIRLENESATLSGVDTVFSLDTTPVANSVQVFLNGLLQEKGVGKDYTQSGTSVTFSVAPLAGDILIIHYTAAN